MGQFAQRHSSVTTYLEKPVYTPLLYHG